MFGRACSASGSVGRAYCLAAVDSAGFVVSWCFPHYQQALLRALATVLIGDSTE